MRAENVIVASMKIKDDEIVRSCRANITDSQYGIREGCYYIVRGQYKDLFTENEKVVFINDHGFSEDGPKSMFDSFENINYRFHRKLKTEAGF